MEEFNQAANTEEVAAPQTESTETVAAETGVSEQTQPDVTQTQVFAQRLKEATTQAEQRARDAMIAEMYGESHGIKTYAEYQVAVQRAQQEREAQQMGIDPRVYQRMTQSEQKVETLEQKLQSIEREKTLLQQDNTLSNDPNVGAFYKQFKPQIQEMATQFTIDYDTALTLILRDQIGSIMTGAVTQAEQSAIQKLTQNAQASTGSLSGGDVQHNRNISQMPKGDFDSLVQSVLRGEKPQL